MQTWMLVCDYVISMETVWDWLGNVEPMMQDSVAYSTLSLPLAMGIVQRVLGMPFRLNVHLLLIRFPVGIKPNRYDYIQKIRALFFYPVGNSGQTVGIACTLW